MKVGIEIVVMGNVALCPLDGIELSQRLHGISHTIVYVLHRMTTIADPAVIQYQQIEQIADIAVLHDEFAVHVSLTDCKTGI